MTGSLQTSRAAWIVVALLWVVALLNYLEVIFSSLAIWSAATLATGFAPSFSGLLAARGVMGVSEAFYIPAAGFVLLAGVLLFAVKPRQELRSGGRDKQPVDAFDPLLYHVQPSAVKGL